MSPYAENAVSTSFPFCLDLAATSSICTGLTESLFSSHQDEYPEHEQASLTQLYRAKVGNDHIILDQIYKKNFSLKAIFCVMHCRWKNCVLRASSSLSQLGRLDGQEELL